MQCAGPAFKTFIPKSCFYMFALLKRVSQEGAIICRFLSSAMKEQKTTLLKSPPQHTLL